MCRSYRGINHDLGKEKDMKTILAAFFVISALYTNEANALFAPPIGDPNYWSCSCQDIDTGVNYYASGNNLYSACNGIAGGMYEYQCYGAYVWCSYNGGEWMNTTVRVGRTNCSLFNY